jgi:hypothetical protein
MNTEELRKSGQIIFECLTGSRAYGLSNPESDFDYRGLFVSPVQEVDSLFSIPEEIGDDKQDIKFYEIKKFFLLASQCNPNIVELLFAPPETVKIMTPIMEEIIANRSLFISTRAEVTFSGYAYAQIEKSRGQNKLVHNPKPEARPKKEDFCWIIPHCTIDCNDWPFASSDIVDEQPPFRPIPLNAFKDVSLSDFNCASLEHVQNAYRIYYYGSRAKGIFRGDDMLTVESIPLEDESPKFSGVLIYIKHEYDKAVRDWKNYWDWMEKRNAHRWEQQERGEIDYDAKNMMHCMRLLFSGKNILSKGEPIIRFEGEQLQYLRDIRAGKFEYNELMTRAEKEMAELKELKSSSSLPYSADMKKLNQLYQRIRKMEIG